MGKETERLVKQHLPDSKDAGNPSQGQPAAQDHHNGQKNQRDQRHGNLRLREPSSAEDMRTRRE
ncbi:hypothetical protein PY310_15625 [Pseudarthrobacter sp. H3Y2-7]|uniref:hypothetical protein n=1 Tax=Pseudarthrobacter naphthalenicus TaxID=3031328 RepID=UPI0023B046CE|nr:hypothetical protein [Pseudarthrobacter sp. H3Y2-7]MDE8670008.1 hypothetical protein [Pseudarthrobacter sp. H3Y2-7]